MTAKKQNGANGAPEITRLVQAMQAPTATSFLMSQRLALEAARFWARRLHAYADQMETLVSCSSPQDFSAAQSRFMERLQQDYAEESAAFTGLLREAPGASRGDGAEA